MSQRQIKLTDPRSLRGYAHPLRMSLLGLLRREGPMTATQAAAELGESVPNCSFHLRQLAKYGLVERVAGADGRERPWQATAQATSWDDGSDDPQMRAATDELTTVQLGQYMSRAEAYVATRGDEPTEWRAVTGFADTVLHVTPAELGELTADIEKLLTRYDERRSDRTTRPADARAVQVIHMVLPIGPVPVDDGPARRV
jgi:DNA-binding transcriptional ArsR family regulator